MTTLVIVVLTVKLAVELIVLPIDLATLTEDVNPAEVALVYVTILSTIADMARLEDVVLVLVHALAIVTLAVNPALIVTK